jgi:hypothetical protein
MDYLWETGFDSLHELLETQLCVVFGRAWSCFVKEIFFVFMIIKLDLPS